MSKTTSYKQPITPLVHGGDSDNGTDSGSSNADSSLSDTPLRTLEVWESAPNADILSHDHLNLQVARSVSSGGSKAFNVVWQSKNIAPSTTISWTSVYALNWHPTEGLSGTLNGVWQPCAFGEVFDLKDKGYWDSSTVQPEAGYMKAGEVNYGYPGVPGIHILLIGIQNDADEFDVIYVDPTSLGLNESVTYQPQESVQWWYQNNTRTATMIKNVTSPMEMREYSQPAPETGKYYYSSTYNYSTGHWITSPRKPGQGLYAPPPPPKRLRMLSFIPSTPSFRQSYWPYSRKRLEWKQRRLQT